MRKATTPKQKKNLHLPSNDVFNVIKSYKLISPFRPKEKKKTPSPFKYALHTF